MKYLKSLSLFFFLITLIILTPIGGYCQEIPETPVEEESDTEAIYGLTNWFVSAEGIFFILLIAITTIAGGIGGPLVGGLVGAIFIIFGSLWGIIPTYVTGVLVMVASAIIIYCVVHLMGGTE